MIIDYKDSIITCWKPTEDGMTCMGANVGGMFLPRDMIEKLYEKMNDNIRKGYCREKPNNEIWEYYQWNGDREDIKGVPFLKELESCFTVGDKKFENFHLDYHDPGTGEIVDLYPGDYIIDRRTKGGMKIDIRRKEEFEAEFFFGK